MAIKRNARPKRRRNSTLLIDAEYGNPKEPCHECSLAHRRVRFSISLSEAQKVVNALTVTNDHVDDKLAAYFQAHLTIANRRDSYEYD